MKTGGDGMHKIRKERERITVRIELDRGDPIFKYTHCTKGGNHEINENVSLRSPYESTPPTESPVFFL
jgi:hypothetical protein